jgi:DNA-binding NarL/FixJ family response regulator
VNQIYARAALSQCETEVLRLLGDGETTAEIATKLKISMKTVQEYCARLKKKAPHSQPQPTHTNRGFVACGRC